MSSTQEPQATDWRQQQPLIPRPDPMQPQTRSPGVELRDFFEMRISSVEEKSIMRVEALAKELAVAMRANAIAIDKAEAAVEKRLIGMNEFRDTLTDQAATLASRAALEAAELALTAKIDAGIDAMRAEIKGMRESLEAKIDGEVKAGLARGESNRVTAAAEFAAVWKMIYTLAASIAVIQAILAFTGKNVF